MVPHDDGKANRGHSCVKGRFAWGYATHPDRVLTPLVRERIDQPWREASWEEAVGRIASEFRRIQTQYGKDSVGAVTSSRCTNEETFLVQKMVRAVFGNNNVDTCARVCHSPTGYGLKQTFGTSAGYAGLRLGHAGRCDGRDRCESDRWPSCVRFAHEATSAAGRQTHCHRPASHRPRAYAAHRGESPPAAPSGHQRRDHQCAPHVIVTEGLVNEAFVRERCDLPEFSSWAQFVAEARNSPEATESITGVPAATVRAAARLYATGGNGAIYYGLGVTEHSQGTTMVMGIANLAMATGNIGRPGVGVNPLRGQNNVQGSCDMGSFPHEFAGYRHVSDEAARELFEDIWGVPLASEPGLRIPNMFDAALDGSFKGMFIQGEDFAQSDPDTQHVVAGLSAMECVVVHDLFLNETAKYAHVFLPGASFLEKDGTFTNAERRISRVRKVMPPRAGLADWQAVMAVCQALGYPMQYEHPSQIMDEIARTTPSFTGVSYAKLNELGSIQWPCNDKAPTGTPVMHSAGFVRGKGRFIVTEYVPTEERSTARFPLLLTTGRILSQYNVGTQTRRTANSQWHEQDLLEIHPHDAEQRGIRDGDRVRVASRTGATELRAEITDRVAPGVVYTTFHHPDTHINVVTTDFSDWATNCPEYKVTAVQVLPSNGTAAARS